MRKAYDTVLQSEVSAVLATSSGGFEPYRYECACCGEEVYVAAAYSSSMVPHFRHRSGNNNVECENYLGQYGTISTDSRSRKSKSERAEFYFDKSTKMFSLGLRLSDDEINAYEQLTTTFELRASAQEQAFFTLLINNRNFVPDAPTMNPIEKFSHSYFLSNTLNGINRKYEVFKLNGNNRPTFFKIQGNDSNYKAKLVRGTTLYTNVPYFAAFQNQYSSPYDTKLPEEIRVDDAFQFETMGRKFLGKVLVITSKTTRIDDLVSSWDYQLESSETLTLMWPPAAMADEVSIIGSDYAFLYSSFELQAYGNINVHSEDIKQIAGGIVSKVSVKSKTNVFRKNAEIVIDKGNQHFSFFDEMHGTESRANTFTVPDNGLYFLFNHSGVKTLFTGQTVSLTPQNEIKHYQFGYLTGRVTLHLQEVLSGDNLLIDILSHYRCSEVFNKDLFSLHSLSDTAALYLKKCEASGMINTVAKQFIEEGRL